jgi:hypothetical protein
MCVRIHVSDFVIAAGVWMAEILQLPKYKRDMRSVLTAGFDDILWSFGGPSTLRFSLRGLYIELVIVPSTKPVLIAASTSTVLTDDMIRSMTDVGRASGKIKPPQETRLFENVHFDSASPTVQSQMMCRELKEQVGRAQDCLKLLP